MTRSNFHQFRPSFGFSLSSIYEVIHVSRTKEAILHPWVRRGRGGRTEVCSSLSTSPQNSFVSVDCILFNSKLYSVSPIVTAFPAEPRVVVAGNLRELVSDSRLDYDPLLLLIPPLDGRARRRAVPAVCVRGVPDVLQNVFAIS
jgi:hypothetical protein